MWQQSKTAVEQKIDNYNLKIKSERINERIREI